MIDGLELVKLIRTIAADEKGGDPFGDGIAAAVEGNYCSIQGDADAAPTPGFYVVPGLNVIVGDHVLYRNADGFKLVFAVLNRDVLTPYPGGGGEAGHLPVTVGAGLDVTDEQLVSLDLSEVTAGGELSGTLAAPTVDTSHSGSTHAEAQAAAEATAASALTAHTSDATAAHAASAIAFTPNGSIAATDVQTAIQEVRDEASGGSGAPTTADYLVGTADAGLSGEIVVGTTPGGELGGTWASPTVDASHGGGTHAATQAAAEATAAGALSTHAGAADPHTGYRLESADHSHASTGLQGGTIAHSATTGQTATDHHVAPAAGPDADVTVDAAGAAGTASTFARSGHGHKLSTSATAGAAIGTAAAGTSGHAPSRDDHVHPTGAGTPAAVSTANAVGTGPAAAMTDHVHAHEAAHLVHDTLWAAKGDIVAGTANDTATVLTAGANDTILMADSAQTTGLKWVASATPSTQAFGDAAAVGTGDTFTRGDHKHAMPAAPTTIANDTIWAAKGDIVAATANDAASVLTVGANDTILMADSAVANGLKWVASATPSTQAFGDAAAVGTADTFTRGDHKHAMPVANRERTRRYLVVDDNSTWTKPTQADFLGVYVTAVGPGGGSGGSGTNDKIAGGGGGGGWCYKWIAAASLGSTETVRVGTGGTAGASGNNAGSAGSRATTFGAHVSAGAGGGGLAGNGAATAATGGAATGGDVNLNGGSGLTPGTSAAFDTAGEQYGSGGGSGVGSGQAGGYYLSVATQGVVLLTMSNAPWMGGNGAIRAGVFDAERAGLVGNWPGGGASGGWRVTTSKAGAAGGDGICEVVEIYGT